MWYSLLIIIICFIVFERASHYLVEGLGSVSQHFEISEAVLGATIAAMGSSAPEFASSAFSVVENHPTIGIGTIVGSAIFNITIIVGGSALLGKYLIEKRVFYRDGLFYLLTVGMTILGIWDGYISRIEAILWVILFIVYLTWLIYDAKIGCPIPKEQFEKTTKKKAIAYIVISLIVIVITARFLILQVATLTEAWGISESIFSLLIVAAGTSVPDFFTSIQAAKKKMGSMAVSNALGSNIFDILASIGIPFSFRATTSVAAGISISLIGLIASVGLALGLMRYRWNVTRKDGLLLIGAYATYVVLIIMV